jgi:transposase InsO family protein
LRIDNGGELCRNKFEELCKKCGIARQKTTPYTPQQNGVVERMNKTLVEKPRRILSGVELGLGILGRGNGYNMLPGQLITLISVG